MKEATIFVKNPDIVSRQFEEETILMPIYKTSEDINCIYTLNKDAARIWNLIDGKNTVDDIKKIIFSEFDISKRQLDRKLVSLIKDLKEIKAVKVK